MLHLVISLNRVLISFTYINILFTGEKPAAMQHANRSTVDEGKSNGNPIKCKYQPIWILTLMYLICMFSCKINR